MPLMEDLYAKERARQITLLPFFYSTSFQNSTVAAGVTVAQTIPIQADSQFVCRYFNITCYASNPVAVVQVTPPLLINFFDTGSGRTLQDNPQPIQNLCGGVAAGTGTGHLPFILPEPWLIRAGAVVQVTIVNIGVLTFPRLDLSLVGMKVFSWGGQSPANLDN